MPHKFFSRAVVMLIAACLLAGLGFTIPAKAMIPATEGELAAGGDAYEINVDAEGKLWVSDEVAGEIWGINPASGAYTVFEVGGSPVDARRVGDYLWYTDFMTNTIGRVSIGSGDSTLWEIPDQYGFYSTFMDNQGRFYASGLDNQYLYRLDAGQSPNNLCKFTLPPSNTTMERDWLSRYMTGSGDYLWVTDWWGQLLRLKTSDNTATVWTLTAFVPELVDREPVGIALDAQGNVWYADDLNNVLGRLDIMSGVVTNFAIPESYSATMLAIQGDYIWYSDELLPGFGRLDPADASYTMFSPVISSPTLTPTCASITGLPSGAVTTRTGTMAWQNTGYPTLVNSGGWQIYGTPNNSNPWGIANSGSGFVVDHGRNMLLNFPFTTFNVFLPVIRK